MLYPIELRERVPECPAFPALPQGGNLRAWARHFGHVFAPGASFNKRTQLGSFGKKVGSSRASEVSGIDHFPFWTKAIPGLTRINPDRPDSTKNGTGIPAQKSPNRRFARVVWEQTTVDKKWLAEHLSLRSAANTSQQIRRHPPKLAKALQQRALQSRNVACPRFPHRRTQNGFVWQKSPCAGTADLQTTTNAPLSTFKNLNCLKSP